MERLSDIQRAILLAVRDGGEVVYDITRYSAGYYMPSRDGAGSVPAKTVSVDGLVKRGLLVRSPTGRGLVISDRGREALKAAASQSP